MADENNEAEDIEDLDEDEATPSGTERKYSAPHHQGVQKRGKLPKKGTPIAHEDPIEEN